MQSNLKFTLQFQLLTFQLFQLVGGNLWTLLLVNHAGQGNQSAEAYIFLVT